MPTNLTPDSHAVGARTVVDTHFHLWDLDENYYPWLSDGDRPSLIKDFASQELRRDLAGLPCMFANYSRDEQELLFWRNAVRFYRLDLGIAADG